jgi:hypothetical protein
VTAPTAERRRHGRLIPPSVDEAHFRPGWSVVDPLDRLLAQGAINRAEHHAGKRFRGLYVRAHAGGPQTQNWNAIRHGPHSRPQAPEPSQRRLDALRRLAALSAALGGLYPVVVWAVVDELCWAEIARRLGIDGKTARIWAAASLSALAAASE